MSFLTIAAVVGIGGTAYGAVTSAQGAEAAGEAGQQQANYQAGIAQLNSQIALQNQDLALATGQSQELNYGMGARSRMGAIRAGGGASGIDIGSGSKAAVQSSQQLVSSIDLTTIHNNAAQKAYNYQVQATEDTSQGIADVAAGENERQAGNIKAEGSLISGAASVASKWSQGQSTGVFGNTGSNASMIYGQDYGQAPSDI